ncbi:restriction endonuclease subunit S [Roseovarius rhodophyticola]|uniref:Restriction endonuclease subunit S n=1 Tax=Roseovarius rhodophyticola TaxID=3080827 RepID=A0ABZ2TJM9_9RHOB|nr:restriction endonuclease subunit S [Roseovarius sp. W115]MDV2930180.1 restriction endonuclease subunit S [Roseovarius sp. W115]
MSAKTANTPKLRFPEFSEKWREEQLGDYFTFKNGINADKSAYGSGRKFINVLDIIAAGPILHDNIIGSVEISDAEFEKNKVVYGDILFQRSSETREEVGQSNVYLDREHSATFGGFVIRGRTVKESHPEFFDCLLKTSAVRSDMTARSGGSTRYNVGQDSLSQVKVIVPTDQNEQQKIAAFLGAVDGRIEKLTRKKALLEDYKKGCMQQLFTRKLRFKDDQGKDFPDWREKRLGDVAEINPRSNSLPDEFLYIDLESVSQGSLAAAKLTLKSEAPSRAQRLLASGDILFQLVRPYQKNNFFFQSAELHVASTGYAQLRAYENPAFLYQLVHETGFVNRVLERCTGTNYPAINSNDLAEVTVQLPCPDEQRKIADFLGAIDTKITFVADESEAARDFKKGLLQQMFV